MTSTTVTGPASTIYTVCMTHWSFGAWEPVGVPVGDHAPSNMSDAEFSRARAEFLAGWGIDTSAVLQGSQSVRDKVLSEAGKYEEVVLWFDACLFDQTIMIKVIDQCCHQEWPSTKPSLVCIGDRGMGKVPPEEYPSLFGTKHEISPAEIELGQEAWKALTSDNPQDIEELVEGDCSGLPYRWTTCPQHFVQRCRRVAATITDHESVLSGKPASGYSLLVIG